MNLTPAQAQPAPVTTTITRVGADLPPALALRENGSQISDAPEVGAADQVTEPVGSIAQIDAYKTRDQQGTLAERLALTGPVQQQDGAERKAAEEGYALSQEAFGIPPQPELQIGA